MKPRRRIMGDPAARRPRSEHSEQVILVARLRTFYPEVLVAAVPNGGYRTKTEAVRLKAEGVLRGFPDLVVMEPRGEYHGAVIEMKSTRPGARASADQKRVLRHLEESGYYPIVGFGADDAWEEIKGYLALPR